MEYDLLVMFTDGFGKIVTGVTEYGVNPNTNCAFYVKNKHQSFMPLATLQFIGRAFDYYGSSEYGDL